jgi:hypothetical protein
VNYQPQKAATRIAQCLLLALSTDKPGECTAAIQATRRALAAAGLDHHALADAIQAGLAAPAPVVQQAPADDWRSRAWFCHHRLNQLDGRDAAFIVTIVKYKGEISEKQRKWMNDIYDRLRS